MSFEIDFANFGSPVGFIESTENCAHRYHYKWAIGDFSSQIREQHQICSPCFEGAGIKFQALIYPKYNKNGKVQFDLIVWGKSKKRVITYKKRLHICYRITLKGRHCTPNLHKSGEEYFIGLQTTVVDKRFTIPDVLDINENCLRDNLSIHIEMNITRAPYEWEV